jgi:hypothetical protein
MQVSVKVRVRTTSETVVDDVEIQHHRHRTHRVHKIDRQINIPTMSTPAFSYVLLCLDLMCCPEKVSQLINHPGIASTSDRLHSELKWFRLGTYLYY